MTSIADQAVGLFLRNSLFIAGEFEWSLHEHRIWTHVRLERLS